MVGFFGVVFVEVKGRFGVGNISQKILFDDLWCSGKEFLVVLCLFRGWGLYNCSYDYDVGVVCKEKYLGINKGLVCVCVVCILQVLYLKGMLIFIEGMRKIIMLIVFVIGMYK